MKRGGPLTRSTPLKAGTTPLRARTALAAGRLIARTPMKRARPKLAVSRAAASALNARSSGWCEMQLHGCTRVATDPSHRVSRGMGGRNGDAAVQSEDLSNLLHACRSCHQWVHANPAEAYDLGLTLRTGMDPLAEPALRRGLLVLLDNAGGIRPYTGAVPR